ncbi:MAG: hypothetical protein K8U57_34195 [Planctomycetes bacterium]|nr:hypothetical protein [Planctomycetota bacterium]
MSETAAKLLAQILALPAEEQVMIADRLNESLGGQFDPDPVFEVELRRRLDSVADGTAVLLDGEHVMAEARAELERRRAARQQNT